MKNLRVINEIGNHQDYQTEFVPRIGERIVLEYGGNGETVRSHYLRVKDVAYHLQNSANAQVAILVTEETEPDLWPSSVQV
jgi:HD superfamily phosphodiesterase